jgi:hypothetical protein
VVDASGGVMSWEFLTPITAYLRDAGDEVLLGGVALAILGAITLLILGGSQMINLLKVLFRRKTPERVFDFKPERSGEGKIILLDKTANELGLFRDEAVKLTLFGGDEVDIDGMIVIRSRQSTRLTKDTILLSPDLYDELVSARPEANAPKYREAATLEGAFWFWNHPDRDKRYANRTAGYITSWTTFATTLLAIGIQIVM